VLSAPLSVVQPLLLDGMFRVVAGIGLVGQQRHDTVGPQGKVVVDVDARAIVAQVPVVGRPGLVLDHLHGQILAGRQIEEVMGAPPGLDQRQLKDGQHPVGGQDLLLFPAFQALADGTAARQHMVHLGVGRGKDRLVDHGRGNVKGALHLVLKVHLPARGLVHDGLHGPHLGGQELLPPRRQAAGLHIGQQPRCYFLQLAQGAGRCGVDGSLDLGRAKIGIDKALYVPLQAEGQLQVTPYDLVHGLLLAGSGSAPAVAYGAGVGTPLVRIMSSFWAFSRHTSQAACCSRVSTG